MDSSNLLMIFDMDGTLIQSDIDYMGIRDKLREILREIVTEEEYQKIRRTIYTILELTFLIKEKDSSGQEYEKAWNLVEEYELKGYEKAFVEDDVIRTLEKLKNKGHILVIYTNNSRKITDYALQEYNFNHLFEFVLTRDDVKNSKPDPEGIYKLMQKYQKDKLSTIFIGDSWVDAETAQNADVKFIYFGSEGSPGTRRKKITASLTIGKMIELLSLY
ncbi:MAG: HAD family hydrolase [Candidatus Heimdallarchaeota archaeon]|nr:HAD family hydrolase [Candidatus Heimdallarchaeota archaeon]